MKPSVALFALFAAVAAWSQHPPAQEAVDWDFEDASLKGWRCKTNTQMEIAEDTERGKVLGGRIVYGEFSFGWFTKYIPETDFTGVWALDLDVRGDGGGGTLDLQLGRKWPKRSIYYRDQADAVALDFTGWRRCRFLLPNFVTPPGRPRTDDLSQVFFVELFVDGRRRTGATEIAFDNIRAVSATEEQALLLRPFAREADKLSGDLPRDGANLLPNPGFEMDVGGDGAPDFWRPSDWGLGSVMRCETERVHNGRRAVSVECAAAKQRGSWHVRVPLAPGHWRFTGWYAALGLEAQVKDKKGVDARITLAGADGKALTAFHARGTPSAGEWRETEVRFEAPRGTTAAVVYLFNYFAKGKVWWDDVHLGADLEAIAEHERLRKLNAQAMQEAANMIESAKQAVDKLRERAAPHHADWQLLVGALEWALEDAQLALDADLGLSAKATLTEVLDYCRRADEIIAEAAEVKHPDEVAPDADANPYYAALNRQAPGFAKTTKTYKKGTEGYDQIANAWTFRSLGEQCAVMAWALLHPRSELRRDPRLLKRLFVNFQAITQNHEGGDFNPRREAIYGRDANINRFCISPMMDALLMLEAEYPWTILPSKREEWRRELRVLVDYQYETYGPREPLDPERPRYYPNMDVHHLLIMEFAHRIFGDSKYAEDRETILQWLDDALYPMGAWTYHWPQNECYVYHLLNVSFIARYYELTNDERARDMLRKSIPYYPLAHDGEGMTESYTDCSWKHYWSAAAPGGPDLIAGMFGDADNKRAALDAARRGYGGGLYSLYVAPWWKDIEPAARKDNVIVYDENIQGPSGWSGRFSFAGTARTRPPGEIGSDTFVGCMISDRNEKPVPLDAALQVATVEFRLKPDGGHWKNARYCSGRERPSVIVAPNFATLCVRYRITAPRWGHGSTDEPWEGIQQWFLCGRRLLGMLTIRALEDHSCAGVWGRLRFGVHKEIERGENGMFKYGSLMAKIHDHSFADIATAASETFFLDAPEKFRSREILLRDAQAVSGAKHPYEYAQGQQFHFLAEVLPYWNDLADDVTRIKRDALLGFSFEQDGARITVVHNEGQAQAEYEGTAPGRRARVFRPQAEPAELPLDNGAFRVTIPPESHVVVVVKE